MFVLFIGRFTVMGSDHMLHYFVYDSHKNQPMKGMNFYNGTEMVRRHWLLCLDDLLV